MEKRKRGVFGPQLGKKFIFYIDDLNLPMKEKYGCINSHELVRQMIAHGGWYDLKEIQFKQIVDTHVVSSMCPAGGSRNPVTQRLLRHFFVTDFLEMNDARLRTIYGSIIEWWAQKVFDADTCGESVTEILNLTSSKIVLAAIDIYSKTRQLLLPTPSKMHYTFNLRDLSKLFQGILMVNPMTISMT